MPQAAAFYTSYPGNNKADFIPDPAAIYETVDVERNVIVRYKRIPNAAGGYDNQFLEVLTPSEVKERREKAEIALSTEDRKRLAAQAMGFDLRTKGAETETLPADSSTPVGIVCETCGFVAKNVNGMRLHKVAHKKDAT